MLLVTTTREQLQDSKQWQNWTLDNAHLKHTQDKINNIC